MRRCGGPCGSYSYARSLDLGQDRPVTLENQDAP